MQIKQSSPSLQQSRKETRQLQGKWVVSFLMEQGETTKLLEIGVTLMGAEQEARQKRRRPEWCSGHPRSGCFVCCCEATLCRDSLAATLPQAPSEGIDGGSAKDWEGGWGFDNV